MSGPWALLLPGASDKLIGSLGVSWFPQPKEKGDSTTASNNAAGFVTVQEIRLAKLIHYHSSKSEETPVVWELPTLTPKVETVPQVFQARPHPDLLAPLCALWSCRPRHRPACAGRGGGQNGAEARTGGPAALGRTPVVLSSCRVWLPRPAAPHPGEGLLRVQFKWATFVCDWWRLT